MAEKCPNCGIFELEEPPDGHPSYLICPSCRAIKLTYVPQDYQEPLHRTAYQYIYNPRTGKYDIRIQKIGVFGGFGSGKSRATLHEILIRALENPNGTGLFTAPTLSQLRRTTLKTFFNEVCPPPLIEYYKEQKGEIKLINGFIFYTIPSDEEEKLRSLNAGLIHIEEASGIKRSIYDQLLTRMRDDNVKNKVIIVCSNPDLGWIKEVFVDNKDRQDPHHPEHDKYDPSITVYIWPTRLNKYLPADFIETISRDKPEWWIKRYLEGSFQHSEGMVYPNFANTLVTEAEYLAQFNLTKIPDSWDRFITLDHGLRNPTAVYFHAINPITWEVVTYDEYYVAGKLVPDHAKALKPKIQQIPYGKLLFMVADPSIRNKTDPVNGKSVLGLYEEYGLFFSPGNNDVEAGILRVNSYIERGKWKIFKDKCPNLVREGLNYKFPEVTMDDVDKNLDERPVKANDHAMDSCFVAGTLIETDRGQVPIEKIKVGDRVLTRQGYFPVIDCGVTNLNAVVYTVKFSNGSQFTATGNHPVWVEGKGFCTVDSLRYGDIIKVSPNWRDQQCQLLTSLNGTGKNGEDTQNQRILATDGTINAAISGFTERFGNSITEKFQKDTTFTTRTETPSTIPLRIWNWWKNASIWNIMQNFKTVIQRGLKKDENGWRKFVQRQLNGTNQKREKNGIDSTPKNLSLNVLRKCIHWFVNSVVVNLNRLLKRLGFALINASLNGAGQTGSTMLSISANTVEPSSWQTNTTKEDSAPVHVVSVHIENQRQVVYNLAVDCVPEYYANGVLVHNCRYGFMRLPDDPDLLKTVAYEPPRSYSGTQYREYELLDDEDEEFVYEQDWTSYV